MTFALEDRKEGTTESAHRPWAATMAQRAGLTPPPLELGLNAKRSFGHSQFEQTGMRARRWSPARAWMSSRTVTTPTQQHESRAEAMFQECPLQAPACAAGRYAEAGRHEPGSPALKRWANRLRTRRGLPVWPKAKQWPRLPRLPRWRPAPGYLQANAAEVLPGRIQPVTRCWSRPAGAWRGKKCSNSFTMSKNKRNISWVIQK